MLKKNVRRGGGLRGDLGKKEGVRPARGGEVVKEERSEHPWDWRSIRASFFVCKVAER